jgi:nickel-dependent lactate racemase
MKVGLPYGAGRLEVDLPDSAVVVEPKFRSAARDQAALLRQALRSPVAGPPLARLVAPGSRVAVAVCDGTRPQPRELMVRAILDELEGIVPDQDVTVLVATGTHRANTEAELEAMLGRDLPGRLKVINHDARDGSSLVDLGLHGDGVPVLLNRHFVDADIRITTGFVEPHFFAGFSGGPKLVAPGLAGLETVLVLHDARRIANPRATWGVLEDNPVHADIRAIASAIGVDFAFDVVLNRDQQIVEAFAGELFAMHSAAVRASRASAMVEVPHRFDVVVTTNGGFPLDQNLYQSVKGMSAAAEVVAHDGLILVVSECRDGFPDFGGFRTLLTEAVPPEARFASLADRRTVPDQWQVQVQARVQTYARVAVHCEGLSDTELELAHLGAAPDITVAVAGELARIGPGATCCVLPEGPQTIPYLRESQAGL